MEEATFLTKFASKVTVIHRRDKLRASKIMAERAMENPKIDFLWDTVVLEVLDPAKKAVEAVRIKNLKTNLETVMPVDGVFIGIGHQPNSEFFNGQLELNRHGYIIVKDGSRTSQEGVFAAGDIHDHVYRQAITAAAAGCRAAIDAERWLESRNS